MKVAWVHYPIAPDSGPARGYMNAAFGMWSALRARLGDQLVDVGVAGGHPRLHLHMVPPHLFKPVPGRTNVLMTMWETDTLPEEVCAQLGQAQRLLVPSEYCRQVWRAHGFDADVVPLGINDAFLTADPHRSTLVSSDRLVKFLWVGSTLQRKGWELLAPAWRLAFGERPPANVHLYVKTIAPRGTKPGVEVSAKWNVTTDTRDLPTAQLLKLYQGADVFVFPSLGEGFGLPPLEAMATGCLALAPVVGGLSEFINPVSAVVIGRSQPVTLTYGPAYDTLVPSPEDVAKAMRLAVELWGSPKLEDRRTYGTTVARRFTWNNAVERLLAALHPELSAGRGIPADAGEVAPPSDPVADGLGQRAPDAQNGRVVRLEPAP